MTRPTSADDRPAVHGMLVVGTGPLYFSHLPMFHPPHDFQLIVEAELTGEGDPVRLYREDRKRTGEKIYTWLPTAFVLRDLLRVDRPPAMEGVLFRGHFERGGVAITRGVQASVTRVLYSQQIRPDGPRDSALRYVVFGESPSLFAAHVISAAPDFDSVLTLSASRPSFGHTPTTATIRSRQNLPEGRLRPGEHAQVSTGTSQPATIVCDDELYFEVGDLAG